MIAKTSREKDSKNQQLHPSLFKGGRGGILINSHGGRGLGSEKLKRGWKYGVGVGLLKRCVGTFHI